MSCSYELVKPDKNVNAENQRIVSCSTFTRPILSASMPASHPPMDEVISADVPSSPACGLVNDQRPISVGIATAYICTSIASSAQPPKQAQNVDRSRFDMFANQVNIGFPFEVIAAAI